MLKSVSHVLPVVLALIAASCCTLAGRTGSENKPYNNQWFMTDDGEGPVAILIHGLNNRPSVMDEIAASLSSRGINCLRVALRDHRTEKPYHDITAKIWLEDLNLAYNEAAEKFPEREINVIGYSLGALLAVHFQQKHEIKFNKVTLIAPALSVKTTAQLIRLLTPARHLNLSLPSAAPKSYALKSSTSLSAYHAMFVLYQELNSHTTNCHENLQIWLADEDEIISESGVKSWAGRCRQPDILQLQGKSDFKHLIIDRLSLGDEQFEFFCRKTADFLRQL